MGEPKMKQLSSEEEIKRREDFFDLFKTCPIPKREMLLNLGLFINRQTLARVLFMNELYKKIISIHGSIFDFGTRWGQNLALFTSFRGIYEPYNYTRRIVGFDTFEGFISIHHKDGTSDIMEPGAYGSTEEYASYLNQILAYHEAESPLPHIKKYDIVKGDAIHTLSKYLEDNPETIIALAYFDFDLYEPTKQCLELIKPHITRGTVIGFDELNHHDFPGETVAFKEVFGANNYSIKRMQIDARPAYMIF